MERGPPILCVEQFNVCLEAFKKKWHTRQDTGSERGGMMARDTIGSAALLTVAALIYFRAIRTIDRNFGLWEKQGDQILDRDGVADRLGPVRWTDPVVTLNTLIVIAPCWLVYATGSRWHDILVFLSLGTLLSPLAMPSKKPNPSDVQRPLRFTFRWALAYIDSLVKTSLALALGAVLAVVPGIHSLAHWVVLEMFPVLQHEPATAFYLHLLAGAGLVMVVMYAVRLLEAFAHGPGFALLFAVGVAFVWIPYQWFMNRVFLPRDSIVMLIWGTVGFGVARSYLLTLGTSWAGLMPQAN